METRRILQLVLALIIGLIVVVGGVLIARFTRTADTVVVKQVIEAEAAPEQVNPWAGDKQLEAAISLVRRMEVTVPVKLADPKKPREVETETVSVDALMGREAFRKDVLKISAAPKPGWSAVWWGETKYGPSYYLVRYAFQDAFLTVGPSWLVDLKTREVTPKNVLARAVMDPQKVVDDTYYDKHRQVVSALAAHRFESKLNLGGALLLYFEQREESAEGDDILGWTIEHDRGSLFRAYFQWVEGGEPTYAEFEFDYDARALRATNLQASNVMRIGEDFDRKERARINPESYDPSASAGKRWIGAASKACQSEKMRDNCKAMETMFLQSEVVEALEWLLTAQVESADQFEACKKERNCKWKAVPAREGVYEVSYLYNLDGARERAVSWEVAIKDSAVQPQDRLSKAAWRAIYPRSE